MDRLEPELKRSVHTLRAAGLEARRTRSRLLVARNPKAPAQHMRETWWVVDEPMWQQMERDGIVEAFDNAVLLGDIFFTLRK